MRAAGGEDGGAGAIEGLPAVFVAHGAPILLDDVFTQRPVQFG